MVIDDFDLQLLDLLKHEGRLSATAIAEKLSGSNHKVQYRMQRLEKQGIIHSYTYLVNLETATQGFYAVFRMGVNPNHIDATITQIMSFSETFAIHYLTGKFNLEVFGLFENKAELEFYLKTKLASIEGILQVISSILLSFYHYGKKILPVTKSDSASVNIDNLDMKICKRLFIDGRATDRAIADDNQVSAQTVANRIKRLQELDVLPYCYARIHHVPLGSAFHASIWIKIYPGELQAALPQIQNLKPIYLHEITGRDNLYMQIAAQSQTELRDFIRNDLETIEGLQDVDSNIILTGHLKKL